MHLGEVHNENLRVKASPQAPPPPARFGAELGGQLGEAPEGSLPPFTDELRQLLGAGADLPGAAELLAGEAAAGARAEPDLEREARELLASPEGAHCYPTATRARNTETVSVSVGVTKPFLP